MFEQFLKTSSNIISKEQIAQMLNTTPESKRLKIGRLVLLIMTLVFGICLHISCLWALQDGRNGAALND